jgi:hypothetical protein
MVNRILMTLYLYAAGVGGVHAAAPLEIASSYAFLVSDVKDGGILYTATAGSLKGLSLPLSFRDSADYWGMHVCRFPARECAVTDRYHPADYSLSPDKGVPGDLQTERVNTHNGANIYDAATWQIAVTLGQVRNGFKSGVPQEGYQLASNQNRLLSEGHDGNATDPDRGANRATTKANVFRYDGETIRNRAMAFSFRMLGKSWLSDDPFLGTKYASLITASGLPPANAAYATGKISWTDWKPITGENAWAFLLGPLHSATLYYREQRKGTFVPFQDAAIQNAISVLPAFAAMQSPLGGVYYAPEGTMSNLPDIPVNPFAIALENNFSLYAGLRLLDDTLKSTLKNQDLAQGDRGAIAAAQRTIDVLLNGGSDRGKQTAGLLSFFRNHAWLDGAFVQGGLANDPAQSDPWVSTRSPRAVDVNTWGIAALGPGRIDEWFGFGAAFNSWQKVKSWGGYGVGRKLWGVGYSDQDGNGKLENGDYRQGVLSAEWTAGAINMVRSMRAYYSKVEVGSNNYGNARKFLAELEQDEDSMLESLQTLRLDRYPQVEFPGKPSRYGALLNLKTVPYLYASRRHLIPFGWFANPLPSTCATSWVVMIANRYDPFGIGGVPN